VEAMIFGPDIIVVLLMLFIFWGIPIWAIVDAATQTPTAFKAAGSSKTLWISLIVIFMIFFAPIAIILALVYLLSVRPRVRKYA
jgi:ribose/xylose/arabinose/galactoside ABC-type transport system permease subunit